jgi:hypothetical protein
MTVATIGLWQGGIYYGIILVQPDIIGAEHSGERCPEYGLAVPLLDTAYRCITHRTPTLSL